MCDRKDLTFKQVADELSRLPLIFDELYPEFFDIKFTLIKLIKRWIDLEEKTDQYSVLGMQRINNNFEELTDRLNVLL